MIATNSHLRYYGVLLCLLLGGSVIATVLLTVLGHNPILMVATLVYIFVLLLSKNIKNSIIRADFVTIYIVITTGIRYLIYPFFFTIEASDSFYSKPFAIESTFVFLIEEITILLATAWGLKSLRRYKRVNLNVSNTKGWFIVLMLISSLFLMNYFPTVGENYQFIWNLNVSSIAGTDFGSIAESLSYVLIDATRLLLPLVLINSCYKSYVKYRNNQYIFLSFAACLLPMLLIKNMNRGTSLFTSLIYLWIVVQLFGWKKSKRYAIEAVGGIFFLLAVVSLVKHAMGIENEGYTSEYFYTMLQSYSLGIESVRTGLVTNDTFSNINPFIILFNDIVGSLPILNKYTVMTMRYTTLYNEMYYDGVVNKNDCIAPMVTNLIYCFGYIGVLAPAFLYRIAIAVYKKIYNAKTINSAFLFVYTSVILASTTGALSTTVATLVWVALPLSVVIKLIDSFSRNIK